jgi:hypothetical protein
LNFTVSLAEGYNDDTSPHLGEVIDPGIGQSGGLQTLLVANGGYAWRGSHAQFALNGTSAFAYYNELSETRSLSHSVGIGFDARLSAKTSLLMNQSTAYSPSYLYGLFPSDAAVLPGDEIPAAPEYSVQSRDTYAYNASFVLSQNFTRRSRLLVSGEFTYTDYVQESDRLRDMRVGVLRGHFSRNVTRNTVLTSGYKFKSGNLSFGFEPTKEHGVDVALDHNRPLSATRRASFGVALGASTLEVPPAALLSTVATDGVRRYFVDAQVSLGYQFARGWQTRALYRRGMEYLPGLVEPVFANGTSLNLEGLLSRRVDLTVFAGYSNGASALHQDVSAVESYTADAQLRYALNRTLAGYIQYLYYSYDFSGNRQLAPGLPTRFERNAVRAGFMLWVPVLQR